MTKFWKPVQAFTAERLWMLEALRLIQMDFLTSMETLVNGVLIIMEITVRMRSQIRQAQVKEPVVFTVAAAGTTLEKIFVLLTGQPCLKITPLTM